MGTLLIQLRPSFTVMDFKNIEGLLERLPNTNNYNYVAEFRHPSSEDQRAWGNAMAL